MTAQIISLEIGNPEHLKPSDAELADRNGKLGLWDSESQTWEIAPKAAKTRLVTFDRNGELTNGLGPDCSIFYLCEYSNGLWIEKWNGRRFQYHWRAADLNWTGQNADWLNTLIKYNGFKAI